MTTHNDDARATDGSSTLSISLDELGAGAAPEPARSTAAARPGTGLRVGVTASASPEHPPRSGDGMARVGMEIARRPGGST